MSAFAVALLQASERSATARVTALANFSAPKPFYKLLEVLSLPFSAMLSFVVVGSFCTTLAPSVRPRKLVPMAYLLSVGIEYLWIGITGFTRLSFFSALLQYVFSARPFAILSLLRLYLANHPHPPETYVFASWPVAPDDWVWSSIVITIIGAIAVFGVIAMAKGWSIGFHIWFVLSLLYVLMSIGGLTLVKGWGPDHLWWNLLSMGWSLSYAVAYVVIRFDRVPSALRAPWV